MLDAKKNKIFFFAGGGTGGHLYPALAIAQRLAELCADCEIHFIGTQKGIETKVMPEYGYPLHLVSVQGFVRNRFFANILTPFRLLLGLYQCARLVIKYKPDAVIGTGGYVSGPMLYMAHCLGRPTLIQEQNSYPGVTTRILGRYVDQIHLSFRGSEKFFKRLDRVFITGNPVRNLSVAMTAQQARRHFGLQSDRLTLLVFGGSQGARVLNFAMMSILAQLMEKTEVQVLWAGGKWNFQEISNAAAPFPQRVRVMEYVSEMPLAYRTADLVVCRAGALTLAELAQCGLAAVLIPFALAAANHQESNALALGQQQAAVVILEKELNSESLLTEIVSLLQNPVKRKAMASAIRAGAFHDATDTLAKSILTLSERKGDAR